jgi:carbamoyl-phosphate synthase large subunit
VPHDIKARYPNDKTGQINTVLGKNPLLFDRYLSDATEVDVDCSADGKDTFIAGIMEHIEEAGIHSGDSACSLPPHTLSVETIAELERQTRALALALKVGGLMNVQYAIKDGTIYVLEVNPRASRTVPFVAKVIGLPVAKIAARIMAGEPLASFDLTPPRFEHVGVKEAVFPFARFPGVDTVLGPEMKSTGEVMGSTARSTSRSPRASSAAVPTCRGPGPCSCRCATATSRAFSTRSNCWKSSASRSSRRVEPSATSARTASRPKRSTRCWKGRPHIVDRIKNGGVSSFSIPPMGLRP